MQGHLPQQRRDPLLALARQQLPNRRRQIAHRGIRANAPVPIALRTRFSAIRRVPSIYERHHEWDIETTFQESRAHLGVETQRQWSDLAIARTTPAIFGFFSLVTLWAADPKIAPAFAPEPPHGMINANLPSATPSPPFEGYSGARRVFQCLGIRRTV
jgi:hypothetical protein